MGQPMQSGGGQPPPQVGTGGLRPTPGIQAMPDANGFVAPQPGQQPNGPIPVNTGGLRPTPGIQPMYGADGSMPQPDTPPPGAPMSNGQLIGMGMQMPAPPQGMPQGQPMPPPQGMVPPAAGQMPQRAMQNQQLQQMMQSPRFAQLAQRLGGGKTGRGMPPRR